MPGIHVAAQIEPEVSSHHVTFAGKSMLLRTNSPDILKHTMGFFAQPANVRATSTTPAAIVTMFVSDASPSSYEYTPSFRGRGYFAMARFTRSDTLWFNLRRREVVGIFSRHLATDGDRWRAHILPALLGILSTVIDIVPVHAGCVVRDTSAVLLAAPSGTGKSTLTVALAKRGYAILADDWTYLTGDDSRIEAWGIPTPVKLLPDGVEFFPELRKYDTAVSLNGEVAFEVDPEECFGLKRALHGRVVHLVLLERSEDSRCSISYANGDEAVAHLIAELEPHEGSLRASYDRQIALVKQLRSIVCLRVSLDDRPDSVAARLDHALSRVA